MKQTTRNIIYKYRFIQKELPKSYSQASDMKNNNISYQTDF